MMERLFCPDFAAIFGPDLANPFVYPLFDTLQWPLLADLDMDIMTRALLGLKDERGHPVFYQRKITREQWVVERSCSGTGFTLFQAFTLDTSRRISNEHVLATCKALGSTVSAILCPDINESGVHLIQEAGNDVAGIVLYPRWQEIDTASPALASIIQACDARGLPVKWDFHELPFPSTASFEVLFPRILALLAEHPRVIFIFSGLDLPGIEAVVSKMKVHPRAWLELDPRSMGGQHPAGFFGRVFSIPGFIQNCWGRVIIGSATPTLEASQVMKGLWDATSSMPFHSRCLLRTWLPRNAARVFNLHGKQHVVDPTFATIRRHSWVESLRHVSDAGPVKHVVIDVEATFQSFAITQLLWIQPVIDEIWQKITAEFPSIIHGDVLIRSYHTTTSLIMNEHEHGNYLQLHYDLVERTRQDPSTALHTVAAEENRPDFNYPDHWLASSIGDRSVTIPVAGTALALGGRENLYLLVTFGPRAVKVKVRASITIS